MSDYTTNNRVFPITPDLLAEGKFIVDIVTKGLSPTAARLLTRSKSFSAVRDRVAVKKSRGTNQGSFAGLDPFNTNVQDNKTYAYFEPRALYQDVEKVGLEEDINALGGSLAINYEDSQMSDAITDFAALISEQIWVDGTGNSNKDMIGFGLSIDSSGTYAGLSRTTYGTGLWAASEYAIGTSSHSTSIANSDNGFNLLRRMLLGGTDSASNTIVKTWYGMQKPTLIVMPQDLWGAFEALYSQVQISGSGTWLSSAVRANYDPRVSKGQTNRYSEGLWKESMGGMAGFECLTYSGIPIIFDEYCPSGTIFFINENVVEWHGIPSVKKGAVTYDLNKGPVKVLGPNTDVDRSMGVTWLGFKEPFNQYGEAGQFILHGALEVRSPKFNGKVTGVTV